MNPFALPVKRWAEWASHAPNRWNSLELQASPKHLKQSAEENRRGDCWRCVWLLLLHSINQSMLLSVLLVRLLLLCRCYCFAVAVLLLLFCCCCFAAVVFLLLFCCCWMNESMNKRINELFNERTNKWMSRIK